MRKPWLFRLPAKLGPALLGLLLLFPGGILMAQQGRPLVDNTSLKIGAAFSQAFIEVTRKSDDSKANLVSDSDVSLSGSLSTPPFFLGDSIFAIGISLSYSEFTASEQEFTGQGQAATGSRAEGQMLIITPSISMYLGRNSPTQFLSVTFGQGWAFAKLSGTVQFGTTLGAETAEQMDTSSDPSPALFFGLEYRLGFLSLGYTAGGPLIETQNHTYRLGNDTVVLAVVFNL